LGKAHRATADPEAVAGEYARVGQVIDRTAAQAELGGYVGGSQHAKS
jgi:hypothetical protein